jgi:hypothetical protein
VLVLGALAAIAGCDGKITDASQGRSGTGSAGGQGGATLGGSSTAGTSPDGGATPFGEFTVTLSPMSPTGTPAFTRVDGVVREAAMPPETVWTTVATLGGCSLETPVVPSCNPPCAQDQICAEGGICQLSVPLAHSVGTVTIEGIGTVAGTTLSMNPTSSLEYMALPATLLYPPFAERARVHLIVTGGDYSPFAVDAKGIAPLAIESYPTSITSISQPISLTWTPPAETGNTRILVIFDVTGNNDGASEGQIVCDADDTGSLEIPAALVTQFFQLPVTGFPRIEITRRAVGSASLGTGRVDLVLQSVVGLELSIAIPAGCVDDGDCPIGQTCQPDRLCG